MEKLYFVICGMYKKFGKSEISYNLEKQHQFFLNCCVVSAKIKIKNLLKEKESTEILKIIGLIENMSQEFR